MNTSVLKDDSTATMDAAQLAVLARKAHEQKRIKECLGLINQLLLCDPGNSEGQTLQAAVISDMEHDLSDARVLLADSQQRNDQKYRKAAEIILLKILYLDPTHAEAKTLLASAKASAEPAQPAPVPVPVEAPKPKAPIKDPMFDDLGFTAQPTAAVTKKPEPRDSGIARKLPALFIGLALLAGLGVFLYKPNAAISAPAADVAIETPARVLREPEPVVMDLRTAANDPYPVAPAAAEPHAILAGVGPLAANPVVPSPVAAPGLLAVNSPISAQIYQGGRLLGETPTTLQLPAGAHTLEYRHGDLRTVMTHEIKSKETITALVSFDVTVQINARPWAQVFVDGTVRKPLGQTPLSSVRVPLGSVLAFENPDFPSKNHRVTEKDSSIQVVFP
jgi:hypothetical protein